MKVIIPIPDIDFDPSEVSVSWKILKENKIDIVFATPSGQAGSADPIMLTGEGLGIFSKFLIANKDAQSYYKEMISSSEFLNPIIYDDIQSSNFDGLLLPGGHAKGMRTYLESNKLQTLVVEFFNSNKSIAAICHGVLLAARSIDPKTNKSVLYNYKTTALLKSQELGAYNLTRLWIDDYYLTYPITVEDEIKTFLESPDQFLHGNTSIFRDTMKDITNSFSVKDRNFLSARWPGDAHHFGFEFVKMLNT